MWSNSTKIGIFSKKLQQIARRFGASPSDPPNLRQLKFVCYTFEQGLWEGAGGTMTPGPTEFRGPMGFRSWGPLASGHPTEDPWASEGPSKWHWENSVWKTKDLFLIFCRSHQNSEKTVVFFYGDLFFFGGHMKIQTKLWHFSGLFWSSQNRKCLIFELTPCPRLALGAPAFQWH